MLNSRRTLTPREIEIAHLVAEGLTDKEIARRIGSPVRTVESHLHHCYRAIGAAGGSSRVRLAVALVRGDLGGKP